MRDFRPRDVVQYKDHTTLGTIVEMKHVFNGPTVATVKWGDDSITLFSSIPDPAAPNAPSLADLRLVDLPADHSPTAVEQWLSSDEPAAP